MTWYAVRTAPGSQKPKREYVVQSTSLGCDGRPRGKGYRIIPSLDPNVSAIERALTDAGFDHYMPAEKRLVRDRRHTHLWKVRRFALMVGYIFVREPDWGVLRETPGVLGIVASPKGEPLPLRLEDILLVRAAEAKTEVEFDRQTREARKKLRKNAKSDPRLQMLVQKLDIAGTISMPLDSEAVLDVAA
ncbi:hypothetical protein GRZ55_11670 [Chelativorans sp. ZYF759]|uniref:transcription termination/antitermination protein NusG n=1 Tax=Chelativorans sp. ZYF759 TaxID=2692213 RepID=UPI00145D953B|nr:transcription termination/antitermination NusG family protein [Chelativorans sp. ZYF759]NMG39902.1 hypothetical protein [Chelativorans sp. ZYF759]